MAKRKLAVVDLFAGAGGLAEGFLRQGFRSVACIERDPFACQTLMTRHAYWALKRRSRLDLYEGYMRGIVGRQDIYNAVKTSPVLCSEIGDPTLQQLAADINRNMRRIGIEKIDVFAGGPPCQAYSVIGRARDPHRMKNDPRRQLYKYYVDLLRLFLPQMFVFENVPGILSVDGGQLWEDVQGYFHEANYEIDYQILDAADYGVLQNRKRVILVGWRKDTQLGYPAFDKQKYPGSIEKLFSDLPFLQPGEGAAVSTYDAMPTDYLVQTGMRNPGDTVLSDHIVRVTNERDREIYRQAIRLWQEKHERLKYASLDPQLKTHRNEMDFADRYKVVASDLECSHTLVAHIAKDGHYYIHPDISQARSISVREAARIQSFPDNYLFEGPRTSKLRQIGNAVPPLLAGKIAGKIKEMLQQ